MAYWGYPEYVPVAVKRAKALKKLAQLRKRNPDIRPVVIEGRTIAKTWWGKSWTVNLERYADYSNRIGRGRSYVANGMVLDLQIRPGEVTALVQGTASQPYRVEIRIDRVQKKTWEQIRAACQGKLESLAELLNGRFPEALGEVFTAKGSGLFPSPREIHFSCSCPDSAYMCKHVAAALYGVGARLDEDPLLFFGLRHVDVNTLISGAVEDRARQLLNRAGRKSRRVIDDANLSDLFGIEMDRTPPLPKKPLPETPPPANPGAGPKRKSPRGPGRSPKAAAAVPVRRRPGRPPESAPAAPAAPKSVPPAGDDPSASRSELRPSSPVDRVEALISGSPEGIAVADLMEKTGFDRRRIYAILYRLKKEGRITSVARGIFHKA